MPTDHEHAHVLEHEHVSRFLGHLSIIVERKKNHTSRSPKRLMNYYINRRNIFESLDFSEIYGLY